MKIIYKTGDLLECSETVIAHSCNAQGVMGSGIAAQIRATYPSVYDAYRKIYDERGLTLGETIWVKIDDNRYVVNLIGQDKYGRNPDIVYANYDAIRHAIREINAVCFETQNVGYSKSIESVAFPLIGAGLANGSWKVISKIIEEESHDFQPVVYLFDGEIPKS